VYLSLLTFVFLNESNLSVDHHICCLVQIEQVHTAVDSVQTSVGDQSFGLLCLLKEHVVVLGAMGDQSGHLDLVKFQVFGIHVQLLDHHGHAGVIHEIYVGNLLRSPHVVLLVLALHDDLHGFCELLSVVQRLFFHCLSD